MVNPKNHQHHWHIANEQSVCCHIDCQDMACGYFERLADGDRVTVGLKVVFRAGTNKDYAAYVSPDPWQDSEASGRGMKLRASEARTLLDILQRMDLNRSAGWLRRNYRE